VLYEVVERLKEKEVGPRKSSRLETSDDEPQPILDFLVREDAFAASLLLADILDGVSGIFKIIQQGPQWTSEFARVESASGMDTTVTPVVELLARFKRLLHKDRRNEHIDGVMEAALAHTVLILEGELANGNFSSDEEFQAARVAAEERFAATGEGSLRKRLQATFKASMKAIDESQGLVKLEEALQHLTIKFRYDVNERPILLPEDASADDIFSFLGVSEAWVKESGSSRATLAAKLLSQWNSYCRGWKAPASGASLIRPKGVNDFWLALAPKSRQLSDLAVVKWSSPTNSAGPERVYSVVTHMDLPGNSTMGPTTFKNTVTLRVNRTLADGLGEELLADRLVQAGNVPPPRHSKRGREEDAAAVAAERLLKRSRLEADSEAAATKAAAAAAALAALDAEVSAAEDSAAKEGEVEAADVAEK